MDEMQKLRLEALIDYIVNTPNNFNANLFREYFMNPEAIERLVTNYLKKIRIPTTDDSAAPSDSSSIPVSPTDPYSGKVM